MTTEMSPRGCSAPPGWLARAAAASASAQRGPFHPTGRRAAGTTGGGCWSQGLGGGRRSTETGKGLTCFVLRGSTHILSSGTAFALPRRQRQLALPWQPGSLHFQLTPDFSVTAEPRKTCLKSESHEQKFTPGNCEGPEKKGVVMFPPCLVNRECSEKARDQPKFRPESKKCY